MSSYHHSHMTFSLLKLFSEFSSKSHKVIFSQKLIKKRNIFLILGGLILTSDLTGSGQSIMRVLPLSRMVICSLSSFATVSRREDKWCI